MSLTIVLDVPDPVTWRAARQLQAEWQGPANIRVGAVPRSGERGKHRVHIGRPSVLRPAISVRWSAPFAEAEAQQATELALTSAAWDGCDGFEPWRALSRPPATRLCFGNPDPARGWLLAPRAPTARASRAARGAQVGEGDAFQLHFFGPPRQWVADTVAWLPTRSLLGSLLGRAVAVVQGGGPLAFDAFRAGVPVLDPFTLMPVEPPRIDAALAGLVPPSLTGSEQLWRHVAEQTRVVLDGGNPRPLCTPEWIARGRTTHGARPPEGLTRAGRKLRKLWREPERFFADSRFAMLRAMAAKAWPPAERAQGWEAAPSEAPWSKGSAARSRDPDVSLQTPRS